MLECLEKAFKIQCKKTRAITNYNLSYCWIQQICLDVPKPMDMNQYWIKRSEMSAYAYCTNLLVFELNEIGDSTLLESLCSEVRTEDA